MFRNAAQGKECEGDGDGWSEDSKENPLTNSSASLAGTRNSLTSNISVNRLIVRVQDEECPFGLFRALLRSIAR